MVYTLNEIWWADPHCWQGALAPREDIRQLEVTLPIGREKVDIADRFQALASGAELHSCYFQLVAILDDSCY